MATTAADQANRLTKLAAPSAPPPQLASGSAAIFQDVSWTSQRLDIATNDYVSNKRQTLQLSMFDQASYVAFNLPVGTVMTLMDNVQPPSTTTVVDVGGCGRCVDLIGTGKTEAIDLIAIGMNDCISSFFWRTVDLNMGAIELFEHNYFGGIRCVIFLSEWNPGTVYPINQWWLQDKISSVRWGSLMDRQVASLFENVDGSGNQFNNIKSWGSSKEVAALSDYGFNDAVSSFRWDGINPVQEIIKPFPILATGGSGSSGLTSVITGTNNTSVSQPVTLTLNNTDAQSVTVATTDTHVAGISSTLTLAESVGIKDVASTSASWSVTLKYDYTHSETRTTSETKTISLSISQTVNAPPNSSYRATLLVSIGRIPPTVYQTTAERWYNVPVTGGVADSSNQGWYKRTEPVSVTMSGSLASSTTVDIKATPLSS